MVVVLVGLRLNLLVENHRLFFGSGVVLLGSLSLLLRLEPFYVGFDHFIKLDVRILDWILPVNVVLVALGRRREQILHIGRIKVVEHVSLFDSDSFDESELNFAFKKATLVFNSVYEIVYNLTLKSKNLFQKS